MVEEAGVLVREAVVVLSPDVGGEEVIKRGDFSTPWEVGGDFEPFGVLVKHGVYNMNKCLVAVEEAVASGEQIAFEPAFALMLAEHFHDAAGGGEEGVVDLGFRFPLAAGGFEDGAEAVGEGFVGAEEAEIFLIVVEFDDVAEEFSEDEGVGGLNGAGGRNGDGVILEIGHTEVAEEEAAVGVGVGAHAAIAFGGEVGEFGFEFAVVVEEFEWFVALEPLFELCEVSRIGSGVGEGDLVSAEGAFVGNTVDLFGAGPAFGAFEDDHGPKGTGGVVVVAGGELDLFDLIDGGVEGSGHGLMRFFGFVAFDEVGGPAVAFKELLQFFVGNAGEEGGVGDFVAVEMEDGEDHPIGDGVEEFVGMPGGGKWAGFGFAVADDASDNQVGIIEDRAEGVAEGVAEFAAFMDGAGAFGGDVAGDAAGEGELAEEFFEAGFVGGDVLVDFGVGAFEVGVGDEGGAAVAGTGDVDHVEVEFFDDAVEVNVDEILTWGGAPVTEKHFLDVGSAREVV